MILYKRLENIKTYINFMIYTYLKLLLIFNTFKIFSKLKKYK